MSTDDVSLMTGPANISVIRRGFCHSPRVLKWIKGSCPVHWVVFSGPGETQCESPEHGELRKAVCPPAYSECLYCAFLIQFHHGMKKMNDMWGRAVWSLAADHCWLWLFTLPGSHRACSHLSRRWCIDVQQHTQPESPSHSSSQSWWKTLDFNWTNLNGATAVAQLRSLFSVKRPVFFYCSFLYTGKNTHQHKSIPQIRTSCIFCGSIILFKSPRHINAARWFSLKAKSKPISMTVM